MSTHRYNDLPDINRGSLVRELHLKSVYQTEERKTKSNDIEDYITYLSDE